MRYIVTRDCEILGETHAAGSIIIIEHQALAARLSSDCEGLLVPIYDTPPDERAIDAPAQDRMVRKGKKR